MQEQLIRASQATRDEVHVCGIDLDDMCAYSTPKMTIIRSWKLGMISNCLKVATVCYIIIGPMYTDRGYMKMSDVDGGGVKTTVFAPGSPVLRNYCCNCDPTTGNPAEPNATFPSPEYHYCNSIGGQPGACCGQMDERGMRSVIQEANGVAVATNFKYETFAATEEGCNFPTTPECAIVNTETGPMYYMMDVESFTIGVSHALSAVDLNQVVSLGAMRGKLMDSANEEVIREWPSSEPVSGQNQEAGRTLDIFSIQELLTAAGVDLEEMGVTPSKPDRTLRDNGMFLLVYIDYTQTGESATSEGGMEYKYVPRAMKDVEYVTLVQSQDPTATDFISRGVELHGIKIVFIQSGQVGAFDFPTVLLTLVSGLALLAGANLATEFLMSYVLSARAYYTDFKTETSVDFSEIRAEIKKGNSKFHLPSYTNFELTQRIRLLEDMVKALESRAAPVSFAFSDRDELDGDGESIKDVDGESIKVL
jgi:hypothetical protein